MFFERLLCWSTGVFRNALWLRNKRELNCRDVRERSAIRTWLRQEELQLLWTIDAISSAEDLLFLRYLPLMLRFYRWSSCHCDVRVAKWTLRSLPCLHRISDEQRAEQRQREHVPNQPSYKRTLQSWHMQTQRVAVFKSFNHTAAQSPMWRCTLHHWKLVLLMLSRVKHGGLEVVDGRGEGGMHCVLDLKWGGAETMAMKKTWQVCEKQPTSITWVGTVPKMVHDKVVLLLQYRNTHMWRASSCVYVSECTKMSVVAGGRVDFFFLLWYQSLRRTWLLRSGRLCRISSSRALCDIYKPIKAECAVFERAGEVKSRVSPMPNCSH